MKYQDGMYRTPIQDTIVVTLNENQFIPILLTVGVTVVMLTFIYFFVIPSMVAMLTSMITTSSFTAEQAAMLQQIITMLPVFIMITSIVAVIVPLFRFAS